MLLNDFSVAATLLSVWVIMVSLVVEQLVSVLWRMVLSGLKKPWVMLCLRGVTCSIIWCVLRGLWLCYMRLAVVS